MSENMKPSGIAWIGDIPASWELSKIRFVTVLRAEQGLYCETDKYIGLENISSYDGNHIETESEYEVGVYDVYKSGDVLFSKLRPYLAKAMIASDNGFCTGELSVIKKYLGDNRFLFYYLLSDGFLKMVDASTYGAKMPRASWEYIKNLQIPMVENIEQTLIANFLDEQCEKIDSVTADIEKQIEVLQKYKKSLITETVTKGLDKSVPMKESGIEWIGQIPEHWISCRIKDKISTLTDYTANGSFASLAENVEYLDYEDYARVIRLTDLRVNFENAGIYVNEEAYRFLSKSALSGNEILLANVGAYAGLMCEMPKVAFRATLGPNMFLIKTIEDELLPHYLYLLSNSKLIEEELVMRATSSAQPKLNKLDVKTIAFILPPLAEQIQIANYLDQQCSKIDSIIESKKEQLTKITQHKKSLIYEYVTGKKRVKGVKDNGN